MAVSPTNFCFEGYLLMPNLILKARHLFDSQSRSRGEEYFRHKAVTFKRSSDGAYYFSVQGTRPYDVSIHVQKHSLDFLCTCPHFNDGNNCKHIWAALMELGAKNNPGTNESTAPEKREPVTIPLHWRTRLEKAKDLAAFQKTKVAEPPLHQRQGLTRTGTYAINLNATTSQNQIALDLMVQERLKKGGLGKPKPAELHSTKIPLYDDPIERDFLWDLIGRTELREHLYAYQTYYKNRVDHVVLTTGHADSILRKISDAGKLSLSHISGSQGPSAELLAYKYTKDSWSFRLSLEKANSGYNLKGSFHSETGQTLELDKALGFIEYFVFFETFCARSNLFEHRFWFEMLKSGPTHIPEDEIGDFLEFTWRENTTTTPIDLPPEINFTDLPAENPTVLLTFEVDKNSGHFAAKFNFVYGENAVAPNTGLYIYNFEKYERALRNESFEKIQFDKFLDFNPIPSESSSVHGYFTPQELVPAIESALSFGWEVKAREQRVTVGSHFSFQSKSHIDWFDINVEFQFGSQAVNLPRLLHTLRTGQRLVTLDDGTTGILPQEWIHQLSPLLSLGTPTDTGLKFSRVQALLLGASFTENQFSKTGASMKSLMGTLEEIRKLAPLAPDKLLKGKLRSYQKQGLTWLTLLSKNGIGGVLADDMGLGKTIQVLAMISKSKSAQKSRLPSLVVAPRSVVFNWESEIARFTPHLKSMVYSGTNRKDLQKDIQNHDIIITTYHTLRNDIETVKNINFEYLIFDEAHHAKNSQAQISMALKLVQAQKKFALTGTPVENSLMDLFTLLAIVNPGLISEAQASRWSKESEPEKLHALARALSPFILRRTKEQVLKDLPEKSEQVLVCELSPLERKNYDRLKMYYWGQLSKSFEAKGLARSKIEVLEALLRLRQASCHQGLLDKDLSKNSSAKFDVVLDHLQTIIHDGHKALVFSQFTSLLELFSYQLRAQGIKYEYLDGQTKDRAERVFNFQNSAEHSVFLLSLKAGGVGLNLTAADYVFILDPWWNPAAEAQAIDRTHRIGQKNKVFAYKVIAKDTIEEKILELQAKKKKLAKAIVSDDVSLLKSLDVKDLAALFQ